MRELILDGRKWSSTDDVYDSLFEAVGAPTWHGRNFNALRDSIETGQINKIEVPYLIRIQNYNSIGPDARSMANEFIDLINEIKARGCPVSIEIDA